MQVHLEQVKFRDVSFKMVEHQRIRCRIAYLDHAYLQSSKMEIVLAQFQAR